MRLSPSGKRWIEAEGAPGAKWLLVGGSPSEEDERLGRVFAGKGGVILDQALQRAGLSRQDARLLYRVPCRPEGDRFENHTPEDLAWGEGLFAQEVERAVAAGAKLLMPLGEDALNAIAPRLPAPPRWGEEAEDEEAKGRVMAWRGSLFPFRQEPQSVEEYFRVTRKFEGLGVLPSLAPDAVARQYEWHPLVVGDFRKAKAFLHNAWSWPKARRWVVNDYAALPEFVDRLIATEHLVAVDSEMTPFYIVALCSEEEVHVFAWDERARESLTRLMASPWVLKVAHNAGHDWTFFRVVLGVDVQWPSVDTAGQAHILDTALPRNLSPAIATRFTAWPFHKWLVDFDPLRYCGQDAVVCYDAYWAQLRELCDRNLLPVSEHDHKLLRHLLDMQWRGVRIDETARRRAVVDVKREITRCKWQWRKAARVVVRAKLAKFHKPHLFFHRARCPCCNGGKTTREHCWRCGGLAKKPESRGDYLRKTDAESPQTQTVTQLRMALPACTRCFATGKVDHWRALHGQAKVSTDMIADVLYRGLGITPRRFKRNETTRADQLAPLASRWPIIANLITLAKTQAQLTTMERLAPDVRTGRLHSTFDPWGTSHGRTASKEGLVQGGTNLQNIEKKYRYVIIADEGKLLVAPDMSQIQGRALAAASGDANLRRMYFETPINWPGHPKHGKIDAHVVVQQVYHTLGYPISRDQAKRQTYAMFFDVSPEQLAVEMSSEFERKGEGCRVDALGASTALQKLWALFPRVQAYYRGLFEECLRTRHITTPTGRVITWNGYIYDRRTKGLVHKVQKEIRAAPPQDMEAWVMALNLEDIVREGAGLVEPLLHIHDEFVAQIPETPGRLVDEACAIMRRCMTRTLWGMEFPVGQITPAKNWLEAKGD